MTPQEAKDEFWDSWHRAGANIKEKTNVQTTRLMYLEDVPIGAVLRFSRCKKTEQSEEAPKMGDLPAFLFGQMNHEEEDYDVTVLDKRESGGMVSLIVVDDEGEQLPYVDHTIKTVRAVVQ